MIHSPSLFLYTSVYVHNPSFSVNVSIHTDGALEMSEPVEDKDKTSSEVRDADLGEDDEPREVTHGEGGKAQKDMQSVDAIIEEKSFVDIRNIERVPSRMERELFLS